MFPNLDFWVKICVKISSFQTYFGRLHNITRMHFFKMTSIYFSKIKKTGRNSVKLKHRIMKDNLSQWFNNVFNILIHLP